MHVVWTEEEKEFVKRNAAVIIDNEIAKQLSKLTGREITVQAIRKQRQKMNIKKCHGRGVCKLVETKNGKP